MDHTHTYPRIPFFKQHWVLPILLAILFLPILLVLPWQTLKIELELRQQQLATDSRWVENGIRKLLGQIEAEIGLLAKDMTDNRIESDQIKNRLIALAYSHTELEQLSWDDASDQMLFNAHPSVQRDYAWQSRQALQRARTTGMPTYSEPFAFGDEGDVIVIDYYTPLFAGQTYLGSIVASYRVAAILDKVAPSWFASSHAIALIDVHDNVVISRADGGLDSQSFTHAKSLDLPGVNLILKTSSTKETPKHLSKYLIGAVLLLGAGLSWSLWTLSRDNLRRQTAEAALQTEFSFRKAMETSLITGLRVRSMDGKLIYVNAAFCKMLGCSEAQLLGQSVPFSFWTSDSCEGYVNATATDGKSAALHGFETVYQHANGKKIPVLIYESAMLDENGMQTGWMGSILDISERKQAEQVLRQHEERLQRSSRLSTMGELASVMAHELNQPLTAINTYASGVAAMVKSQSINFDELQPALEQMKKQAFRAAQIIRSVHDFVAKRGPIRTRTPFNDVFKNVLPLIEMQAKSYLISLKVDFQHNLPDVFVDPISLEQVILNLTRNALQSMQELTLPNRVLQIIAKRSGNFICVEVVDKGAGISTEVAGRLFSPFFSTKAEGMGMGLNICRTIIEFHGGQLSYRSNPEGGTIFSFTVPVVLEAKKNPVHESV